MFVFFHALALALGLFGGFGGGFSHVGGATGAPMMSPADGGGSMPGPGSGGSPGSGGQGGG